MGALLIAATAAGRDWTFTGTVQGKAEWQKEGVDYAMIFLKINTENVLMDEIRLIYNPTNGTADRDISCWMLKPMPSIKCPARIPALVTTANGRQCKIVFESDNWDIETKNKGLITLKSMAWIKGNILQKGRPSR